jgi:hypothetical protein
MIIEIGSGSKMLIGKKKKEKPEMMDNAQNNSNVCSSLETFGLSLSSRRIQVYSIDYPISIAFAIFIYLH